MADSIFKSAPIEIPNKSGFDMSHENFFTATCGTLTPCLVDYLLPNDTVSVGFNAQIQLPPMATDFYGEVVGKYELFFVPYRILYGGWKDVFSPLDNSSSNVGLPFVDFSGSSDVKCTGSGTLADFLGLKTSNHLDEQEVYLNVFPFLAYHKVWDDWYRDARLQKPCFYPASLSSRGVVDVSNSPWYNGQTSTVWLPEATLYNGVKFLGLHQRNWPKDYFTNASLQPQAGDAASISFSTSGTSGSFTIAGLRAANSLQMFMERNNIAGNRYQDRIRAHYGVYPSDAVTDKAIYLGSGVVNVYTKSIFQSGSANDTENPFNSVGAKYGSSQGVGGGSLCKKFTASEHGILLCLFSLVPRRYYSTGSRRQLNSHSVSDIPYPSLAGVGDQEIYTRELSNRIDGEHTIFGYTQRYAEYKFMSNEVHGLLRDGESLSSFCLQSAYNGDPELCSDFIEIPTGYLDQVSAVSGDVSKYGCWNDTYFSYKKVSTLPAYSIPTLENMKHSHLENVPLGGTRL